jgi:addiction module HigA family antidote
MNKRANDLVAGDVFHPGVMLADELSARSLTQKVFAEMLGIKANVLNELIKGKRNFTAELSVKVEKALGTPAETWMRMQYQYEIHEARLKVNKRNQASQPAQKS